MPEIKEIRKFADFISQKIKNKEIFEIKILNGRYKTHGPFVNFDLIKRSLPIKVKDVKTKGKFLYIELENELYLFSTMGLSGGWCYLKKGMNGNFEDYEFSKNFEDYAKFLPESKLNMYTKNALNHLNVEFKTNQGSLYYFDVLSFGSMKVVKGRENLEKKLNEIGPDIMEKETTFELFQSQIKKPKNLGREIGLVLMDQKVISGIGNYLRSDILYISKISPFRKIKDIEDKELKKIYDNSKILTWGDYDKKKIADIKINIKLPSDYNRIFYIYNQPDDIYGNKVEKKELYIGSQKRFIYYVPKIQI